MKIEKNIYFSCLDQYWNFSILLAGKKYFPFIRSYLLTYEKKIDFTLSILQEIFLNKKLTGVVKKKTLDEVLDYLQDKFLWESSLDGKIGPFRDEKNVEALISMFFDILRYSRNHSIEKTDIFWIYYPGTFDYFSDATYWSLCFAFTYENKIVVFSGKAMERIDQHESENEKELKWKRNLLKNLVYMKKA